MTIDDSGEAVILQVGQSVASAVDGTVVIVIRAPSDATQLTCGGVNMVAGRAGTGDGTNISEALRGGSQLGKRYVDEAGNLEVLCTKPGVGTLAVDGRPLTIKQAKPLPSSD